MKKYFCLFLSACICFIMLAGCQGETSSSSAQANAEQASPASSSSTPSSSESESAADAVRTIIDQAGTEVVLPYEVNSIIDLWHANNQVVLLLGGADKLVGTTSVIQKLPWYAQVYPRIKDVPVYTINTSEFNAEEILKANPDVVITSNANDAENLRNAGITTVLVTFRDFDGLKETVRITGDVLGSDAVQRAEEYIKYFDGNLKMLSERLGNLTEEEKPKVYQVRSANLLETDGKVSICTQWIEAAGGINAIADVSEDNQSTVTMEEILKADPDVIVIGAQEAQPIIEAIKSDPAWSTIKAVAEDRIYPNPVGTFLWSRYSCEESLQVLWLAKLLHPDKFEDLDMVNEVQNFYKTFYDYDMIDEEAELMLQGLDPQ